MENFTVLAVGFAIVLSSLGFVEHFWVGALRITEVSAYIEIYGHRRSIVSRSLGPSTLELDPLDLDFD